MQVTVALFASFRHYLPPQAKELRFAIVLPEQQTVNDLLRLLALPVEIPKVTLVNGDHASGDQVLRDNDMVSIFPPLPGG
jgi:molybdopterin converting factor small subunit